MQASTTFPTTESHWWDWLRWAASLGFNGLAALFWGMFGAGAATSGGHPARDFVLLCVASAAVPAIVSALLAWRGRLEWAIAATFTTIPALIVGMLVFAGLAR
jgi:hypothetical protein